MTYDNDPDREPRLSDPVVRGDEQSGMTMMGIVAAIAVALIVGLVYFNMGDENSSTATDTNTSSGVTTGSSPPSPASRGEKCSAEVSEPGRYFQVRLWLRKAPAGIAQSGLSVFDPSVLAAGAQSWFWQLTQRYNRKTLSLFGSTMCE